MDTVIIILVVLAVLAFLNLWFAWKKGSNTEEKDRLQMIAERIERIDATQERMRGDVDEKLESMHRAGQHQFREAREIIADITGKSDRLINHVNERLSDLDKTNQKIVDFSAQLKGLQDVLKNPKQRGVLGEFILEHVLSNALPPASYKIQYTFSDGEIVDGAIFVKDKIVPVDAKFSLENYERVLNADTSEERERYQKLFKGDLKKRIDETAKYIRPDENTTEFAFMFIPSESIYYDLLVDSVGGVAGVNSQNMIEYAFRDKHVVIVSPTSFLAYLQTVLQGLRSLEIEENARHIKKRIGELSRHWNAFDAYMEKLGKTMSTSVNHFNTAYKELGKIDRDVMRITERDEKAITPTLVEKPSLEEK